MRTFDRPVTLCWAVEDRFFTERLGRRLAATFPQARFVAVQDARTFVMWDQPQAVVAALHDLHGVDQLTQPRDRDPHLVAALKRELDRRNDRRTRQQHRAHREVLGAEEP